MGGQRGWLKYGQGLTWGDRKGRDREGGVRVDREAVAYR